MMSIQALPHIEYNALQPTRFADLLVFAPR
jgi:hypothetical protein